MISLIDVVLMLVVFFMLSSQFMDEGRVRIHLPQATGAPASKQQAEPLIVAVTQAGQLSRERAGAHQLESRDAARRAHQGSGVGSQQAGHRARGRPRHASIGHHRDGRARPAGLHRNQHRHGQGRARRASLERRARRSRGRRARRCAPGLRTAPARTCARTGRPLLVALAGALLFAGTTADSSGSCSTS